MSTSLKRPALLFCLKNNSAGLNILIVLIIIGALIDFMPIFSFGAQEKPSFADSENEEISEKLLIVQGNSVMANASPSKNQPSPVKKIKAVVTAYSSDEEQTDSDPFITASGINVKDGVVAANFLPFGTKIKIPEVDKNKIFVVEDRMNPKKNGYNHIDVWLSTYSEAVNFGAKITEIEILGS